MGRSTDFAATVAAQQSISTMLTAGEAVQRGDLALVGADGKVYWGAIPGSGASTSLRPPAGGPQLDHFNTGASIPAATSTTGSGADLYEMVKLSNGNFAVVFTDGTGTKVKFAIITQDSIVVLNETGLDTACNANTNVSAVALAAGGFAIGYVQANGTASVTLLDNAGNITKALFAIDPATTARNIRIAQLNNGNIVSAVGHNTFVRYSVYTQGGVAVKAATQIGGNASYGQNGERFQGVVALAGGGFVVAYNIATSVGASTTYSQRYDAAGTAQGGVNVLMNGSAASVFTYAVALTGGGYAVAAVAGGGGGGYLGIYDGAGAVQGSGPFALGRLNVEIYGNQLSLAAAPNGDVGVCYAQSLNLMVLRWTAAGAIVRQTILDGIMTSASLTFTPDNFAIVAATANTVVKVYHLTPGLFVTYTTLTTSYQVPTYPRLYVHSVAYSGWTALPAYMLGMQISSGGGVNIISTLTNITTRQRMTLTGVITAGAAKDAPVPVQITGVAALRQPFAQAWVTNQNGSSPPGQKMYAVGGTAVLNGIQPLTTNPIN